MSDSESKLQAPSPALPPEPAPGAAPTPPNQMSPLVPLLFFGAFLLAVILYGAFGQ